MTYDTDLARVEGLNLENWVELSLLEAEVIKIPFNLSEEVTKIKQLMKQYQSVPMSLADACLVRMSELIRGSSVFTRRAPTAPCGG